MHWVRRAPYRDRFRAGSSIPARIAVIAITTSSSTSVNGFFTAYFLLFFFRKSFTE